MNEQDANEEQVERTLYNALIEAGLLIPTTEEEVEIAERLPALELPASLRDPHVILARKPRKAPIIPITTAEQNLARAAREGKPVPPHVEARMRQDRKDAEQR
jgi:hypothetical protein